MKQNILRGKGSVAQIGSVLRDCGCKKFLVVCGWTLEGFGVKEQFDAFGIPYVTFTEFKPNPLYEEVKAGIELFLKEQCDCIVAIGGGSAIDVAKCIKLYCKMDHTKNYLEQECADSGVPLIAVPTTAGTGSESTRFAVIYYHGVKQSVTHDSIVPDLAVLDHGLLGTLPVYQKKCAMLDALCQAIESWWSVNSTDESKKHSRSAIRTILKYRNAYIAGDETAAEQIMLAANEAGQAICITQTTAPHAMSYKFSSKYKLPHGHAVAVCLPEVWRYMLAHPEHCIDPRGADYLTGVFGEIAAALGYGAAEQAVAGFEDILSELDIAVPPMKAEDLPELTGSVNVGRLRNSPVALDEAALYKIFETLAGKQHEA